jgi:hypothetical protein
MNPYDRLLRFARSALGLLFVAAVGGATLRSAVCLPHSGVDALLGTAIVAFVVWQLVRAGRRLWPKRTRTPIPPPTLPGRAEWMSPRTLKKGQRFK